MLMLLYDKQSYDITLDINFKIDQDTFIYDSIAEVQR